MMENIEEEIRLIKERNKKVEADKAWETSWMRISSVALITYVVAAIVLFLINVENYLLGALVPTIGYYLSTQSLPLVKKFWMKRYRANTQR